MSRHYINSWDLYKTYNQNVDIDFDYYFRLCNGHKTLDLFAGFGRVTNFLKRSGVDVESVESEANFAKFIHLEDKKKHVCDVLDFETEIKYDRVIAPFNSFCLITNEESIYKFFKKIQKITLPGSIISLSYYHHDFWGQACSAIDEFYYKDKKVEYSCKYDLSKRNEKVGIWIDIYDYDNQRHQYNYPVRLYESEEDLYPFLNNTDLKLIDIVKDYNKLDLPHKGWIEYVLQKQ